MGLGNDLSRPQQETSLNSPHFPRVLGDEGDLRPVESRKPKGSNGSCEGFDPDTGKLGKMHSDHQQEHLKPACKRVATCSNKHNLATGEYMCLALKQQVLGRQHEARTSNKNQ